MALTNKQLNAINSCPVLKELKDWIIAMDAENEPEQIKKYYFISYADASGTTEWDRGTVKTTGVTSNNYSQVVVTSNSDHPDFVGEKYYVVSNAKTDGTIYQLYADAGSTSAGIYVKISLTPFPEEDDDE